MLTAKQRKTLNDAMDIILANTPKGASWHLGPQNYHGTPGCSVTYFTSRHTQYSEIWQRDWTFADKVQRGLELQTEEDANSELARAARIERLRKELADLTEQAA